MPLAVGGGESKNSSPEFITGKVLINPLGVALRSIQAILGTSTNFRF